MEPTRPNDPIVLGFDRSATWLIAIVCGALGVGLGAALPWLARLAADLRWMPFSGPIRQFGEWDGTWATAGRLTGGLVLGVAFAGFIVHESPVVTVASDRLTIRQKGSTRYVDHSAVSGVFRDGREVVVVTAEGRELFRGDIEGGKDVVRDAFVSRGYPWESD